MHTLSPLSIPFIPKECTSARTAGTIEELLNVFPKSNQTVRLVLLHQSSADHHDSVVYRRPRVHDFEERLELLEGDDSVAVRIDKFENIFEAVCVQY